MRATVFIGSMSLQIPETCTGARSRAMAHRLRCWQRRSWQERGELANGFDSKLPACNGSRSRAKLKISQAGVKLLRGSWEVKWFAKVGKDFPILQTALRPV